MAINETIDWNDVPENLLLKMVPEHDPDYGGTRTLALNNAKKIYAHLRSHDAFDNMCDKDIVRKLQESDSDRFDTISALAKMMYSSKEGKDLKKLMDTNFESWFGNLSST